MKKIIFSTIVFIAVVFIILRFLPGIMNKYIGIENKAGIKVLSQPQEAQVFIDGVEVGKTPYENQDLKSNDVTVKLVFKDLVWEGGIKLNSGTITIVNRDLSNIAASSAGETLTLEQGKGIVVISKPSNAEVIINDKFYGNTPLAYQDLSAAEYTINLSYSNYLKRSIRAFIPENYKLIISVDLAISEADLSAINTVPIITNQQLVVKNTPTNFLRVRDKPNLNGKELARVSPGDKLIILEELVGWYKVRLSDGKEGYVSASYVEKVDQASK